MVMAGALRAALGSGSGHLKAFQATRSTLVSFLPCGDSSIPGRAPAFACDIQQLPAYAFIRYLVFFICAPLKSEEGAAVRWQKPEPLVKCATPNSRPELAVNRYACTEDRNSSVWALKVYHKTFTLFTNAGMRWKV